MRASPRRPLLLVVLLVVLVVLGFGDAEQRTRTPSWASASAQAKQSSSSAVVVDDATSAHRRASGDRESDEPRAVPLRFGRIAVIHDHHVDLANFPFNLVAFLVALAVFQSEGRRLDAVRDIEDERLRRFLIRKHGPRERWRRNRGLILLIPNV